MEMPKPLKRWMRIDTPPGGALLRYAGFCSLVSAAVAGEEISRFCLCRGGRFARLFCFFHVFPISSLIALSRLQVPHEPLRHLLSHSTKSSCSIA